MSNSSARTRRPAPFRIALAFSLLIFGAALAILWARAIVPLATPAPMPVSVSLTLTTTQVALPTATSQPATPTRKPTPTPSPTAALSLATPTRLSPLPTPDKGTFVCRETVGRVVTATFSSKITGTEQRYRAYLPPCYDQTDGRYPTLYLIHGSADDDTHWENLGLFQVMDEGLRTGKFPPAIIVLPDGDWNLYMNTSGGARSYEGQMVDELIPLVDRTFRTDLQAKLRAIGGISRGGVWSLEIGFRHPELFAIVGGHSAALNVNKAPPSLDPVNMVNLPSLKTQRIWLDAGDTDYVQPGVERLHRALDAQGVPHTYQIWSGPHDDSLWAAHLSDYLAFYTQAWPRR